MNKMVPSVQMYFIVALLNTGEKRKIYSVYHNIYILIICLALTMRTW